MSQSRGVLVLLAFVVSAGLATALRGWNAVHGSLLHGYDAWGHISYVLFLDMYRAIPHADQGWSYFHPPLHYLLGWALMQAGDPQVLVVGLSLLGGAASLGVAAVAARVIALACPGRPELALLGFSAVAFLPVHVYVSPMPGNEMTATFVAALAFFVHLRNESAAVPGLRSDLLTGLLCGLAMLSKFSDLVPVLAIFALTLLRWLRAAVLKGRAQERRHDATRLALRLAALALPLLLVAGPYYARNVLEFGTPFMTSAEVHDVKRIQESQPPGERSLADFFRFPIEVFEESVPSAPHLIRAVWPNTYLNVWFDSFRESQLPFPRDVIAHPFIHQLTIAFGVLGVVPTLVFLIGASVSARRAFADPRNTVDLGMLVLALGTTAAFTLFAIQVPTWAALKASYLLNLSLPFALFLARGTESLWRRSPWLGAAAPVAIGVLALATSYVFAAGPVGMMRRDFDSMQMHSLRAHFGDFRASRIAFRADSPKRSYLEARAAAELFDGEAGTARRFYLRAARMTQDDPTQEPYFLNRLAVATALDGEPAHARRLLDSALAAAPLAELLVNRAVLRAEGGDFSGAEQDLREALELDPMLPPAWLDLAVVLARQGRGGEAAEARARGAEALETPPRGFPYGVGNGFLYDSGAGQRFMLVLEEGSSKDGEAVERIALYRPPRARNHPPE
jgi:tetratricopeptide (TPR) repeat protein